VRRYTVVWVLALAQGALGVVQYRLGVPEPLVSLHVLGSFAVLIATGALWCAGRDRGQAPREPSSDTMSSTDRPVASEPA
jgi:cytochrome c oxidase assembly protein subunit 15